MKKYLLMLAAVFSMALTATVFCSCGGDDDEDGTPSSSKGNYMSLDIVLSDDLLDLYSDLAITYTLPGIGDKTVPLTKKNVSIKDTFNEDGKVNAVITGTLIESKVDPEKTYALKSQIDYEVKVGSKTFKSYPPEQQGGTYKGSAVIEHVKNLSHGYYFTIGLETE